MDDILFEIKKIEYIENIISHDLDRLAYYYLKSCDTEIMLFPKNLKCTDLLNMCNNIDNVYNINIHDLKKPLKELIPRFVNHITRIDPNEYLDENRMFTYLTYYSEFIK